MMKKRLKKILIFIVIVAVIIITPILVLSNRFFTLRGYFDDWKNETDFQIAHIFNSRLCYINNTELHLPNYSDELYIIENDRVYYSYTNTSYSDTKDTAPTETLFLMSVSIKDGTYQEHAQITENGLFGYYLDHVIYLQSDQNRYAFDIASETLQIVKTFPQKPYVWHCDNHQSLTISKLSTDETRVVTLDSMAKTNNYAKNILEGLVSQKDGKANFENFFYDVRIVNHAIFILCDIRNFHGSSDALIFLYDFENDSVQFVSHNPLRGSELIYRYDFVLIDSD